MQISYGPINNMDVWIRETFLEEVPIWHRNPSVQRDIESISLATAWDKKTSRLYEVSRQAPPKKKRTAESSLMSTSRYA